MPPRPEVPHHHLLILIGKVKKPPVRAALRSGRISTKQLAKPGKETGKKQ
jgi:hypothetical protein